MEFAPIFPERERERAPKSERLMLCPPDPDSMPTILPSNMLLKTLLSHTLVREILISAFSFRMYNMKSLKRWHFIYQKKSALTCTI